MPPATRVGDNANCPADSHGKNCCAHGVTGPAVSGSPDVFIDGKPAPDGRATRRRLWFIVGGGLGCLGLLAVAFLVPAAPPEPDVFAQNDMAFTEPSFRFHGIKPKEMEFEIWARFASMSPSCRGKRIIDSREMQNFALGVPDAKHKGVARKCFYVDHGETRFSISIPLRINDAQQCEWDLFELDMYAWHPYTSKDPSRRGSRDAQRNDLILFRFPDYDNAGKPPPPPMPDKFDVFCQKMYFDTVHSAFNDLKCRHPEQTRQSTAIDRMSLQKGGDIELNVRVSDNEVIQR